MEEERSPVIEGVVGGEAEAEAEVSRPEETPTSSLFGDALSNKSGDGTYAQGEESETVDPRESSRSYDFGASMITIGRIRQLEALGILLRVSHMSRGKRLFWSRPMKSLSLRSFSRQGFGCCRNRSSLISWLSFVCNFTS
jgi:hypothetical protein